MADDDRDMSGPCACLSRTAVRDAWKVSRLNSREPITTMSKHEELYDWALEVAAEMQEVDNAMMHIASFGSGSEGEFKALEKRYEELKRLLEKVEARIDELEFRDNVNSLPPEEAEKYWSSNTDEELPF